MQLQENKNFLNNYFTKLRNDFARMWYVGMFWYDECHSHVMIIWCEQYSRERTLVRSVCRKTLNVGLCLNITPISFKHGMRAYLAAHYILNPVQGPE